jgi:hypothetical protein
VQLKVPFIIVSRSTPHIESASTFTAFSTDSDNIGMSSEKENCKHGTFPSIGFCVKEQSLPGSRRKIYTLD